MTDLLKDTAIVLLASGLSRRFPRANKLMAEMAGSPVIEHVVRSIEGLNVLARIAVCAERPADISERLEGRFVIAPNKKPKAGVGNSIATGVHVARQFKPSSIIVCMGDMPFLEPETFLLLAKRLADQGGRGVVHCGAGHQAHPPTIFGADCFDKLEALKGDIGAQAVLKDPEIARMGMAIPKPQLRDIDTPADLQLAVEQLAVKRKHLG